MNNKNEKFNYNMVKSIFKVKKNFLLKFRGYLYLKIAIVGGTGDQGIGLALRFANAGLEVIIGSRDVKKAENTVNLIKNILKDEDVLNIYGTTNSEAAEQAD